MANLRDDLELVDLEFDTTLAEECALAATIRFEFLGIFCLAEIPLRRVLIEPSPTVLP